MSGDGWGDPPGRDGPAMAGQAARLAAARSGMREEVLVERIDHLTDLVQATWELLGPHLGFTDAHLDAKLNELAARRREQANGAQSAAVRRCHACDAGVGAADRHCQWCGAQLTGADPFHR